MNQRQKGSNHQFARHHYSTISNENVQNLCATVIFVQSNVSQDVIILLTTQKRDISPHYLNFKLMDFIFVSLYISLYIYSEYL